MSNAPAQLDYAQTPPWHRRKTFRHWLILLGAVLVAVLIYAKGSSWLLHGQLLYWQYRCMNYSAQPDQIVYDSGPMTDPAKPDEAAANERFQIAHPWDRYYTLASPPGFRSNGTLFLHERISPDGTRFLVAIDLVGLHVENDLLLFRFHTRTFASASLTTLPEEGEDSHSLVVSRTNLPTNLHIRFFAGQIDPKDDSHFTIQLDLGNRVEIIDGWIRDDGNCHVEQRRSGENPTPPSP